MLDEVFAVVRSVIDELVAAATAASSTFPSRESIANAAFVI